MKANINTIIFDLGGVLIDWNPRYLYRKIFDTEEEITWFLENICTPEWNDEQDGGRTFEEATDLLVAKYPEWELPIRAWYGRWEETISGPVHGTVDLLKEVRNARQHRLYALTNWSAQSFPVALKKFDFLHWFEGIVVSGIENTRKPFPEIYQILFNRYQIDPKQTLFIDDNPANIVTGKSLGLHTIQFKDPQRLRNEMVLMGLL
ncbi:MAG: HAD family hydrolase [Cyclobacteriaceae bacterium]